MTLMVAPDGGFEGLAAVFGAVDMAADIILPGAFRASLGRRGAPQVRMLFQHDPAEPIGVWTELVETAQGLLARGRIVTEVARGREIIALMRAGGLDGLSIGFRPVRAQRDARTGTRRIAEIDLWEISVVTFPMQPAARVKGRHPIVQRPLPCAPSPATRNRALVDRKDRP